MMPGVLKPNTSKYPQSPNDATCLDSLMDLDVLVLQGSFNLPLHIDKLHIWENLKKSLVGNHW